MKITALFLCLLFCACIQTKQSASTSHLKTAENLGFFTTDIDNFWKAYALCNGVSAAAREKIFDSIYIKNASSCLQEIITARQLTAAGFVKWINSEPVYFAACKPVTDKIKNYEPEIREYFTRFKTIYPAVTFCDVYFMFTQFYTGGQSKNPGIAIGMDYWSLPDTMPVTFNSPMLAELVRKIEVMPVTVIHELTHRNQIIKNTGSLLGKCLVEGSADFIAYLVTSKLNSTGMYAFANVHEDELWSRFKKDMLTNDPGYWLYNSYDSSRPRDLGYWMGFKICENYYNISADKTRAVYDIMNIRDVNAFLVASKYAEKFN